MSETIEQENPAPEEEFEAVEARGTDETGEQLKDRLEAEIAVGNQLAQLAELLEGKGQDIKAALDALTVESEN